MEETKTHKIGRSNMTNSIEKEIAELKTKMVNYDNLQNEGSSDGYNPYRDQLKTLLNKVSLAKNITQDIEWTKEVTIQRREEWKQWVLKVQENGKVSAKTVDNKQDLQGWVLSDLRTAIKNHNL